MNWPLSSDDSEFWQDVGVTDVGEVGRNGVWAWSGKLAEPDPGVCAGQSGRTVKPRQVEAAVSYWLSNTSRRCGGD